MSIFKQAAEKQTNLTQNKKTGSSRARFSIYHRLIKKQNRLCFQSLDFTVTASANFLPPCTVQDQHGS